MSQDSNTQSSMANDKHHFEQAIMTACTDILKENVLCVLLKYISDRLYNKATPQFFDIHQSLIAGLAKLNRYKPYLSIKGCLDRIEEAIESEKPEIIKSIVLDVYKVTNGPQVSIFLLEKINEYTQKLCLRGGVGLSEVHSIITAAFEEVFPGDDSFAISPAQPEDLDEYYKERIQRCINHLLEFAQSKVCLHFFIDL